MSDFENDAWQVEFTGRAKKQKEKLPEAIKLMLDALIFDLKTEGPERRNWPHYGKIKGKGKDVDMYHCHLNKGRPSYVAVWIAQNLTAQIMEVRHVDTHENTNYRRIN